MKGIKRLIQGSLLLFLLSLAACQQSNHSQKPREQSPKTKQAFEGRLTLNNATLEQSNIKGQTLWKIQVAEAFYSPDKKKAQLKNIKGNLLQDGKVVLKVSADEGEIYRDGEEVFLKKNIIAVDPRNQTVIRSEEVEWLPRQNLLIVRKPLRGNHAQLETVASKGQYNTRKQQLELSGDIVATDKKPRLQLKTDHLIWDIPGQKLIGDRPLKLVRYQDKIITDQVAANYAEVRLNTKEVLVQKNIDYKSLKPPIQVAADSLLWQYKDRILKSDKPIQMIHYEDHITLTANQGEADLTQEVAHLKGGVQGINDRTQAKLYANELTWNITAQILEATGNIIYEQAKPKFNLTGEKAVGTLKDNNIVVSSNRPDRVVTEIYPNSKN